MQIHLVADKDGIKEWAIIELQGSLRCSDTFDGEMIGNLLWDGSTALFLLGHQVVQGKAKALDNPLVVISKSEQTNRNNIVAIIRKKIIFSSRPKPIVFNLPSV
uniref:Chromosome transmission fidelity protein 8 n=2 Tax=Parascaris univalens TaxID=6257 RepID=A0A914ZNI6_PARUN